MRVVYTAHAPSRSRNMCYGKCCSKDTCQAENCTSMWYIQRKKMPLLPCCTVYWLLDEIQSVYWASAPRCIYNSNLLIIWLTVILISLRRCVALWCINAPHWHNNYLDSDTSVTVCVNYAPLVYATQRYFILDCDINVTSGAYVPQWNNKKVKK